VIIKTGTSKATYETAKVYPGGKDVNIVLSNTDANIMTVKVWGYVTKGDTTSGVEIRAEGDLAASTDEEVSVTKVYEEIIVSFKTKTDPNHSVYKIHAAISKVGV